MRGINPIYPLFRLKIIFILSLTTQTLFAQTSSWKPVEGHIMTKWAAEVSPDKVWQEYPRPQMVRTEWKSLNGLWDYAIMPTSSTAPITYQGQILVPFPVESALSGVKKSVGDENKLWYHQTFDFPAQWSGKRILLHFDAVDWQTAVYVNGKEVGTHTGGYDPFYFDITDHLIKKGKQSITLSVWDPTDSGTNPRGKQVKNPQAIWYTPVTGIWQSVWAEPVPSFSIENIKNTPDIDNNKLTVSVTTTGSKPGDQIKVVALDDSKVIASVMQPVGNDMELKLADPKLWSPDAPFLYDLKVSLIRKNKVIDEVTSYFGMRKISLGKDQNGVTRILFNNKFLFQYGTLDQGWWPDGLYTAPNDEALLFDIEVTKSLGFNTIRKHVKVEPARWYYHCDKLGMIVWQDMPSGDKSAPWQGPSGKDGLQMERSSESEAQYRKEWKSIIDSRYHFPCIAIWVPFNEGWGQFKTEDIIGWTMKYDPSRLVDGPSGGNHFPGAHILDHHQYPGPGMPATQPDRAIILGEFGGLGLPLKGHLWKDKENWGYKTFTTKEELENAYAGLINKIPELKDKGLSAAIYTQTTDVESEINGLMTYDRAIIKMNPQNVKQINSVLYEADVSKGND